jgi:type IV pilus assembly protein PilC
MSWSAVNEGSGITILECLANSRNLANNQVISRSLDHVVREIEAGKNLTQSFQKTGIFPPLVIRMLKVGEATGQLDQALMNVSYFYDRMSETIKVQVMIEPGDAHPRRTAGLGHVIDARTDLRHYRQG